MIATRLKYCLSVTLSLVTLIGFSQPTNQNNQAMVTIVGDAPNLSSDELNNNSTHDFISNSNPYNQTNEPQIQQELTTQNNTIEPTLENGFHVRFEINSQQAVEPMNIAGISTSNSSSSSSSSSGSSSAKPKKKSAKRAERSFNAKKKLKSKLPHRKKKYHPHLCGRF